MNRFWEYFLDNMPAFTHLIQCVGFALVMWRIGDLMRRLDIILYVLGLE